MNAMTKQCTCSTPERGPCLVCRRCGGEYGGKPREAPVGAVGENMTTERMTDEQFHAELDGHDKAGRYVRAMLFAAREAERARRVEQEQAEKIRQLEDMLRLANDKMAERERQARLYVAEEFLTIQAHTPEQFMDRAIAIASNIRDANSTKD